MIRGLWDRDMVALLLLAALLPVAIFWMIYGGTPTLLRFGLSASVIVAWNAVFLFARAQVPSFSMLITALAVAMLVPEDLGPFRLILGVSFGIVFGELVFGGWGRNIINPATVAVSFIGFGFPGLEWPEFDAPVLWATIPAVLIGGLTGVMPLGVMLGAALLLIAAFHGGLFPATALSGVAIVFVVLLLDPATNATTKIGRWMNGAMFAGLVILFSQAWLGAAPVQYAVAAALLTNLTAPLLDEIALTAWAANRRRRHGKT